jgi:hypothetical protein
MGLLASGTLLAVVNASASEAVGALDGWRCIGRIEQGAPSVIMGDGDSATPLPAFERDELARYFETRAPQGQAYTPREGS